MADGTRIQGALPIITYLLEQRKMIPFYIAQQLTQLVELYVNDAFGTAHQTHATTTGVAAYAKISAVAGILV